MGGGAAMIVSVCMHIIRSTALLISCHVLAKMYGNKYNHIYSLVSYDTFASLKGVSLSPYTAHCNGDGILTKLNHAVDILQVGPGLQHNMLLIIGSTATIVREL